jgi:hypothetical protein
MFDMRDLAAVFYHDQSEHELLAASDDDPRAVNRSTT